MDYKTYFISIAETVASKSKDPSSRVGAIIVDKENRIVSSGYNGMVSGCDETIMGWDHRPKKYLTVVHAEMNSLIFAKRDLKDCVVYCTAGPCENCLKHLLQSGIRKIVYKDPGIMRDRGTIEQKEAIRSLIEATGATVVNMEGVPYIDEI